MIRKAFSSGFREFRNRGQVKIQKKRIIELGNRLRSKKTDVFQNFLTVDSDQLLSVD